jgi:hypothetical protein
MSDLNPARVFADGRWTATVLVAGTSGGALLGIAYVLLGQAIGVVESPGPVGVWALLLQIAVLGASLGLAGAATTVIAGWALQDRMGGRAVRVTAELSSVVLPIVVLTSLLAAETQFAAFVGAAVIGAIVLVASEVAFRRIADSRSTD